MVGWLGAAVLSSGWSLDAAHAHRVQVDPSPYCWLPSQLRGNKDEYRGKTNELINIMAKLIGKHYGRQMN